MPVALSNGNIHEIFLFVYLYQPHKPSYLIHIVHYYCAYSRTSSFFCYVSNIYHIRVCINHFRCVIQVMDS